LIKLPNFVWKRLFRGLPVSARRQCPTTYKYGYNNRGRLNQLTTNGTVTATYAYDGLDRMSVRTTQNMTPAGTTHYIYDRAGRLLAEATAAGVTQREYVWIDDTPLALYAGLDTSSPQQWYVHPDHLNRPSRMTDANQKVVWDAYYWPYGQVRAITGTATNNLRFPGQYFLAESGLHYNWHRHYDPTIGRYTQADPIADVLATQPTNLDGTSLIAPGGISGGSQLALNFASAGDYNRQIGLELPGFVDGPSVYAYARSAPSLDVDPTGEALPSWQTISRLSKVCALIWHTITGSGPTYEMPPEPPPIVEPASPSSGPKAPPPEPPKLPPPEPPKLPTIRILPPP
jgi:RHS repeat-associated protein